jgi:cytoskeletal protein RodZ
MNNNDFVLSDLQNEEYSSLDIASKRKVVAEILRLHRLERSLTFAEVANALKLKEEYIKILETGEWDKVDSKIYVYGYVKLIANFLKIDTDILLEFVYPSSVKINEKHLINVNHDDDNSYVNSKKKVEKSLFSLKNILILLAVLYIANRILLPLFNNGNDKKSLINENGASGKFTTDSK